MTTREYRASLRRDLQEGYCAQFKTYYDEMKEDEDTPPNGAMNPTNLWAVHLAGPDEIHAAPSKEAAEQRAKDLNEFMERHGEDGEDGNATVIPWPSSEEQHANDLKQWNTRP